MVLPFKISDFPDHHYLSISTIVLKLLSSLCYYHLEKLINLVFFFLRFDLFTYIFNSFCCFSFLFITDDFF